MLEASCSEMKGLLSAIHTALPGFEMGRGVSCVFIFWVTCVFILGFACVFFIVRKQQSRTRGPWVGPDIGDPRLNIYIYIYMYIYIYTST